MQKQTCHDCKKNLKNGEEAMEYKIEDRVFLKCKKCHEVDPALRNFQKTEIYSRIVGYMRPLEQWNIGKKEEYKDRKEFKAECC